MSLCCRQTDNNGRSYTSADLLGSIRSTIVICCGNSNYHPLWWAYFTTHFKKGKNGPAICNALCSFFIFKSSSLAHLCYRAHYLSSNCWLPKKNV